MACGPLPHYLEGCVPQGAAQRVAASVLLEAGAGGHGHEHASVPPNVLGIVGRQASF